MTTTNGKQRSLAELREQLTIAKTERALRRTQNEVRLMEAYGGYTTNEYGSLVDPSDAFRDYDMYRMVPMGSRLDRQDGANRPWVWSDLDLDFIRAEARMVDDRNPLVKGVLDLLTNYVVKTGFTWQCLPKKKYLKDAAVAELCEQLDDCVDEFSVLNSYKASSPAGAIDGMGQRERDAFRTSRRDGETITRFFCQPNGTTVMRPIWSEQIRQPPGSPATCYFGWEADPDDIETPIAFYPAYHSPEDWQAVPAEDISFHKINVDPNIKRGISDLFSTGESFDGVWKLLKNMRETGAVQACIPWIEQYDQANQTSVQGAVAQARDSGRQYQPNVLTGKTTNFQRWEPGTIPKVGKGRTYIPAPLNQNSRSHMDIVQACLRAIGCRWNMPESMVSGEGSNMAELSAMVQGSPFVVGAECQQDVYEHVFAGWRWVAIRNAARYGRFNSGGREWRFEEIQKVVELHGTAPALVLANKMEEAQIDQLDMQSGVLSKQTRRARRDLDDDKELQNLKTEPMEKPQQAAPGGGPGAPPPQAPPVQEALKPDLRHTVAALQVAYHAKQLSREAAIANVRLTCQLSPGDASMLFPPIIPPQRGPEPLPPLFAAGLPEALAGVSGEQQAALEEHLAGLSAPERSRARRMLAKARQAPQRVIIPQQQAPIIQVVPAAINLPAQPAPVVNVVNQVPLQEQAAPVVNVTNQLPPLPKAEPPPPAPKIKTVRRKVTREGPDGPATGTEDSYEYEE